MYGKGLCYFAIATSRLSGKSEKICVRLCTRSRVLRVDCEFSNYDFVITSWNNREEKRSMPKVIQGRGITSGFEKTYRDTFFNHSRSFPSPSIILLLTTTGNCISNTNTLLPHFWKADSHTKERVSMVGHQCGTLLGRLFTQPQAKVFIQTDASNKGWGAVYQWIRTGGQ